MGFHRSHHFHSLKKLLNPSQITSMATHFNSSISRNPSTKFQRPFSISAIFETESINPDTEDHYKKPTNKPLHVFFKEAVGLAEKIECSESESDGESKGLKMKLRKIENDVRILRKNDTKKVDYQAMDDDESKSKRLYALFANEEGNGNSEPTNSVKVDKPMHFKELSPDMILFASHLYKEGYFRGATFLSRNKFDATCFEDSYGRGFLRFAAEKFGKDNQEIAKWLSGSDLKKVAMFGCPSLGRKAVFSAKSLRTFFKIQEDRVCCKCVLKKSCKYANQRVWEGDTTTTNTLNLVVAMKVITSYALEEVSPQLVITDEIKTSVSKLLKDVVSLSLTIS